MLSCTTIRVREHTRESYLAPPERDFEDSRLIQAPPSRVFQLALAELQRRAFVVGEVSQEAGRVVASGRFRAGDESPRFAVLGEIEKAVTRTTRRYRSFNPRYVRCEPCIVHDGRLVDSQTVLIERSTHPIDVDLEVRAVITLRTLAEGSRLRVELELDFLDHSDLVGRLEPRSSGAFERSFLDTVEAASRAGT